jgi:hypothetical protein|tara:strand:+ start:191 stop:418 length:228 start_codon:yes stop_codon:yes gene_type:complete
MNLSIEERWYRIKNTTHVVRPDDLTIYRVKDQKLVDEDLIFIETESDLWFQDLDVMTLEECAKAERAVQAIKDYL